MKFINSDSPIITAKKLDNKGVKTLVKTMAVGLCTAHRMLDGYAEERNDVTKYFLNGQLEHVLLRNANEYSDESIWIRSSELNYNWAYKFFLTLLTEYDKRFDKKHKYEFLIEYLYKTPKDSAMVDVELAESKFVYKVWDLDKQEWAGKRRYKAARKETWTSVGAAKNAIVQGSLREVKNYEIYKFSFHCEGKV